MAHESLSFRMARLEDVEAIVRMLADDPIAAEREGPAEPLPSSYEEAFEAIDEDPHNELIVAELEGRVVGTLQLTIIPNLTYRGGWRALIEGVRIEREVRGQGYGSALMQHAVERARQRGCHVVQLMTNKERSRAQRFYEDLGFEASHHGMKLHIDENE